MEKKKGIRDLMEKNRYRPKHLQESLIEKGIPGSWSGKSGIQNIYNLIDGKVVPKDAYVFVFLSTFLGESLETVLMCYTSKKEDTVFSDIKEPNSTW
jgi:hypothetical protein